MRPRSLRFIICTFIFWIFPFVFPFFPKDHIVKRANLYWSMPDWAGTFPQLAEEMFNREGPIDILFIGGSFVGSGIEVPAFKEDIEKELGRKVNVISFAHVESGYDLDLIVLQDLLAQRPIRLVVWEHHIEHINKFWFGLRPFWDLNRQWPFIKNFPLSLLAKIYVENVLNVPGSLYLSLTNRKAKFDQLAMPGHSRDVFAANIYAVQPPLRELGTPVRVDEMLFDEQHQNPRFKFLDSYTPYEMNFINAILSLLKQHGTSLVLLHVPSLEEGAGDIPMPRAAPDDEIVQIPKLGMSVDMLLPELDDETRRLCFRNPEHTHILKYGSIRFSRALVPAIAALYEQAKMS